MKQQGIDVTVPIWSGTTTNNLIEFPALQTLKSGRYQWNVVSNNTKGVEPRRAAASFSTMWKPVNLMFVC